MKMSKLGPNCLFFVWQPLFSSTALTLLGMEFTRASQVSTGVLSHSSMTTSPSWWMLETLRSSTFRLRKPHRLPLPSDSLARQWLSWRCVWGRYRVGILPCGPDKNSVFQILREFFVMRCHVELPVTSMTE